MAFFSQFKKPQAPEFPQGARWLFGGPLTARELKRSVSLVFFFGVTNMASVRTLPFVQALVQRYPALKLVGVQVPEYAFEADETMVRAVLERHAVTFPVLLDHERKACGAFQNQWLPRIFLIGPDGAIVYDHIGEGGHAELEMKIQQLLLQAGATNLPTILPEEPLGGGICYRTTADLSFGYVHGAFAFEEVLAPHEERAYTHKQRSQKEGEVALHGHWRIEQDYVEHTREVAIWSEYVAFQYSAFSVNLVAEPLRHGIEVSVELDGKPVPQDSAGEDMTYNDQGQSMLVFDLPRVYRVIDADTCHKGELKMRVKGADIRLYGAVFGGCRNM